MITVQGINSVIDRTIFTNKGPIVKKPEPLLTGNNLQITSETSVNIPTANFNSTNVGHIIEITGTPSGRNDGEFFIEEILTSTRVSLKNVNFDISDVDQTTEAIVDLANDIRSQYESHRLQEIDEEGVHGSPDLVNVVVAPAASDLPTAIVLLNDLRTNLGSHVSDISGSPSVHIQMDADNIPVAPVATNLPSALYLVNDLRAKFESHRQKKDVHSVHDSVNIITEPFAKVVKNVYPGDLTGPFTWTLKNPYSGMVADHPIDVDVTVNGNPVTVNAVFGMLGAIILQDKPDHGDSVNVSYDWMANPPARFLKLNSPEFNLNQWGNNGLAGFPKHKYRARSYLIDPGNSPDLMSPVQPKKVGWKYKGLERSYTAVLNDPTSLLFNVPTNKVSFPVLFEKVLEQTIRYDPTSLPHNSTDPWEFSGTGTLSLSPGGNELTVNDLSNQTGPDSMPPFFSRELKIDATSIISAGFRLLIPDDNTLSLDGVFTGVSFGISNGLKSCVVGFIITKANNLTSVIKTSNDIKAAFNSHIFNSGSHSPNDSTELVELVDADDLESVIILLNKIKENYLDHISKGDGVGNTHLLADTVNTISSVDAFDLSTAISLANEMRNAFNGHASMAGAHFIPDLINTVELVKQVGLLNNSGPVEEEDSWESFAFDWTEYASYRLSIDSNNLVNLYLSGNVAADASLSQSELPSLSDVDAEFTPAQQVFFGSISREATNASKWQFIRVNISPVESNLIENNKKVDYDGSVVPHLITPNPWITLGQEGYERIVSPDVLLLDSTASTPNINVDKYGVTSSNFRGSIRLEPILTSLTAASLEFNFSADYYTNGISNNAIGVILDDDNFSVQLSFLQASPTAASAISSVSEPFTIVMNDDLIVRIQGSTNITIVFQAGDNTAALIASRINTTVGFTFAFVESGKVRLRSDALGADANFEIVSGSALSKLGFSPGIYSGRDSNPEPRLSWFGANFPNEDIPAWTKGGTQLATMVDRVMRISDLTVGDFLAFNQDNFLVTENVFNNINDWKLDFRIRVLSYQEGSALIASGPYSDYLYAGVLISVDEGPSGKNIELHFATDGLGGTYLNLVSFNGVTGNLDVVAQYAFSWDDGEYHSYNIFTSKNADLILVLADGSSLSPIVGGLPSYSGLNTGIVGPAISFGSGSEPAANIDLKTALSVVDWDSVNIFRDEKISRPELADLRYIGIYQGGDVDVLSSYALHQIDWTVPHTYRIVRNPVTSVNVYVDGSPTPSISIAYNILNLPPVGSGYLSEVADGRSLVGFGSFNLQEMSRTRWNFIKYSIGKITLTDRIIPPHQVFNQHNVISSPDHLFTTKNHGHSGHTVYSGGTPLDNFMADEEVSAHTQLGEGTPPIPMTQDLTSRGGLIRVATPADGIDAIDLVNTPGFMSDLEDDANNILEAPFAVDEPTAIELINDIRSKYLNHLVQDRVHLANDNQNDSILDEANDLTSAIELSNSVKDNFNLHRTATLNESQKVHSSDDFVNTVASPDATDLSSLITLVNDIASNYGSHLSQSGVHGSTLFITLDPPSRVLYDNIKFYKFETGEENLVSPFSDDETDYLDGFKFQGQSHAINYDGTVFLEDLDLLNTMNLANDLRAKYESHRIESGVHALDDTVNSISAPVASDLASLITLLLDMKEQFNDHLSQSGVHSSDDVDNIIFSTNPNVLAMAKATANELKFKYENHRQDTDFHLISDKSNIITAQEAYPVADPGWVRSDIGGSADIGLHSASGNDVLRYGTTTFGPVQTVYTKATGLPDSPSIDTNFNISMRINMFNNQPVIDTGIYAGFLSNTNPGISVGLGFDVINNIPYVKLHDVNSNKSLFRVPFNWGDGNFHSYRIVKDSQTGSISLIILS